jgi:hypothetical protein
VTPPVGIPEPDDTLAVNVTKPPNVDGFRDEVTAVLVTGSFTVNALANVAIPVPLTGALFVTETLREPGVAVGLIVTFAVIVPPFTIVVFTVMPVPRLTELTPLIKLLPVKTTSSVWATFPLVGAMAVSVGDGLLTVNAPLVAPVRLVDVAASV